MVSLFLTKNSCFKHMPSNVKQALSNNIYIVWVIFNIDTIFHTNRNLQTNLRHVNIH